MRVVKLMKLGRLKKANGGGVRGGAQVGGANEEEGLMRGRG